MRSGLIVAALGAMLSAPAPAEIVVTSAARSIRPGELVVLTIATIEPAATMRVRGFNRDFLPFALDSRTWRVLVGIDLSVSPGTYLVRIETGDGLAARRATYPLVVRTRSFPTRILKVDEAFVSPPPDALERIRREAEELNRLWDASAPERLWDGPFVRPVPDPANSAFGTRSVFNGRPRDPHSGADFRSAAGTPVKAPNGGRIALASARYFTGNTVVIDHGLSVFSLLAHLSEINVKEGDRISAGDVIGRVGATGRVTGPHLHWSVRATGARVDPLSLLWVLGTPGNP